MRERELKIATLKWLLSHLNAGEQIATELHFSHGLNRADLVQSSPQRLVAYEIKSSFDDFRRFNSQQLAYKQAFLEFYLVVPLELHAVARSQAYKSTGILLVDHTGSVIKTRTSARRQRLTRDQATAWLRDFEKRALMMQFKDRKGLDSFTEKELTQAALASVYDRIKPRFDSFLSERGSIINSDDLLMLSLPSRVR